MNLSKFFNKQNLKKYKSLVAKIHRLESEYQHFDIYDTARKLLEIKDSNLSDKDKTLHALLLTKKASQHVLGMAHYDVQLMGALALVDGFIAEMKTGEGKTLTCSAAVAANFVLDYSTHVATANEYLAIRDEELLRPLYSFMGISSSCCTADMDQAEKQKAYTATVVYSTAQELGFDLLRDNLVKHINEKMQPLDFSKVKAIIDEADFILIDEARTPLIISGQTNEHSDDVYHSIKHISEQLTKMHTAPAEALSEQHTYIPGDFWVDAKHKTIHFSEEGYSSLEELVFSSGLLDVNMSSNQEKTYNLYSDQNVWVIHEISNALKARYCFIKDKDYIVHNDEVIIIDPNTGRLSEGRTWSNGLHQAIEAKENVVIHSENTSLGTISIQNFFRVYGAISGMSGTIMNSSEEFEQIYGVQTIQIPTNAVMIRKDYQDMVYLSMEAKYAGLLTDILERHQKGQPILIGTTSVSESETISNLLDTKKIKHHVLNAKNNFKEAQIIAQAGQPYAVTVSTSMAGRGTDIILGGHRTSLENILNTQLRLISDRKLFFFNIIPHDFTSYADIQEDTENSISTDSSFEYVDFNEIQEHVHVLYQSPYIEHLLNRGMSFTAQYLHRLEQSVLKQLEDLRNNWQQWRDHVLGAGGLFVIGSSRNESRRIDDQLRGRAGRQGDPGESVFYLSIEDPWVNLFGQNPLFQHLAKTLPPDAAISTSMVTKAFARAQANIEAFHFNSRKHTFQYDSITDEGRRQFFRTRDSLLLDSSAIKQVLRHSIMDTFTPLMHYEFIDFIKDEFDISLDHASDVLELLLGFSYSDIEHHIHKFLSTRPHLNLQDIKASDLQLLEQRIDTLILENDDTLYQALNDATITQLDSLWQQHLIFMEEVIQNVGFSALAQKNPLQEYRRICFDGFSSMIQDLKKHTTRTLFEFIQNIDTVKTEGLST